VGLASDADMEFREDGRFLAWPDRGAGAGTSLKDNLFKATKGKEFYPKKALYLLDFYSGEEGGISISIAANRFMLANGGVKQVFEKVKLYNGWLE
jgi:hypothetical protein